MTLLGVEAMRRVEEAADRVLTVARVAPKPARVAVVALLAELVAGFLPPQLPTVTDAADGDEHG